MSPEPDKPQPLAGSTGPQQSADVPAVSTDIEQSIVLAVPPKRLIRLRGHVRQIRAGRTDLALSDSEWADWFPG
jgi:hypothetical protein